MARNRPTLPKQASATARAAVGKPSVRKTAVKGVKRDVASARKRVSANRGNITPAGVRRTVGQGARRDVNSLRNIRQRRRSNR